MEVVFISVALDFNVHIFGRILSRAETETVKPHRIFVIRALVGIVFSAGVKLAVKQLPVVALLLVVEINRRAAAEVLHLNRAVGVFRDGYFLTEAFARLVYRVGDYLKNRMFAAVQSVRTENNARTFSNPVRTLELFYTVVAVFSGCFRHLSYLFP